ncbi:MAG: hypothetical protein FJ278_18440, partial [Planctomycetes bacterium]|nr:hypothetical protein [Planctomycetota bacterium]
MPDDCRLFLAAVSTLFFVPWSHSVGFCDLAEWSAVNPERAYWVRGEASCVADGNSDGWSLLVAPQAGLKDATLEFDVLVERPPLQSGRTDRANFRNYWAGRDDAGSDVAAVLRYQNRDSYYSVQFSTRFGEVALWKSTGGIVRVAPCQFEKGRKHRMKVTAIADAVSVSLDGAEVLNYRDEVLPIETGAFGLAVYGAKARFDGVSIRPAEGAQPAQSTSRTHSFSLKDWRGEAWIFDRDEPIALLDKKALILWIAKLKPGFRPVLYWELFWKQYDSTDNYSDKLIKLDVLKQDGPELALAWQSQDKAQRFTTSAQMLVTYD